MKPLVRRIFLSKDFYNALNRHAIKSPVVLVISTYRKLGLRALPTIPDFGRLTGALGQTLFDPPNVAGWAGGRTWITPATLMQRGNLFRDVLFADAKGFRAPDRLMPFTYARVGENLAKGMNVTEATKDGTGDAESNAQVERDEDYNTRYASYRGYVTAFERTKPIPRRVADLNLTAMVAAAHAGTPEAVVDHFAKRFLSVPLSPKDRGVFVEFLRGKPAMSESALRELLYLADTPDAAVMKCDCSRRDSGARTVCGTAGATDVSQPHHGSADGAGAPGHEHGTPSRAHPRRPRLSGGNGGLQHGRAHADRRA